jgi:hypothetical protein
VKKIEDDVIARGLGPNGLLFELRQPADARKRLSVAPESESLGMTEPNADGRRYEHGSLSAYSAGKCRCEYCRGAYAKYRRDRRAAGKDSPRQPPRFMESDGHIPRDWFRNQVWLPSLKKAKLGVAVQAKHMRHAHASWLLHGGADLQSSRNEWATQRYPQPSVIWRHCPRWTRLL